MLFGSRLFAAAFFIGALASPNAVFAQKITVDPNAPGSLAESAQTQFDDTEDRLAQKVTLQLRHTSVANILSVLSGQTGVDLRAGINSNDWQVRDRRMNIFCKDLPLSNLMNSIARVMKFKWSKEKTKSGAYAYRLYMDRKTLLDAEAQAAREEAKRTRLVTERRQKALESYAETSSISEEELAKLRKESPFKYMMASCGLAKALDGLFAEAPSVLHALSTGRRAEVSAGSLSPRGKSFLMDTWRGAVKIMSAVNPGLWRTPDDAPGADNLTIYINRNLAEGIGMSHPYMLGLIELRSGPELIADVPLIDPDSRIGKLFGDVLSEAMETGEPVRYTGRDLESRVAAAFAADMRADSAPEEQKQRPDDPALRVKVKIKPDSPDLDDVLCALADAAGIAVVSDSFLSSSRFPAFITDGSEAELLELLQKIEDGFQYDWDKPASALEFRDRKWFARRAAQIPDSWIEAWREKLQRTGVLDLNEIAQICSLTPEQFYENIPEDKVLGRAGIVENYYAARDILKLYGMLTDMQRSTAFVESGLDLRSLSPEQWAQAAKALSTRRAAPAESREPSLRFSVQRVYQEGELRGYRFAITQGDDAEPIRWFVSLPRLGVG